MMVAEKFMYESNFSPVLHSSPVVHSSPLHSTEFMAKCGAGLQYCKWHNSYHSEVGQLIILYLDQNRSTVYSLIAYSFTVVHGVVATGYTI